MADILWSAGTDDLGQGTLLADGGVIGYIELPVVAARIATALNAHAALVAALKAWQQWEADWILTDEAWATADGLPRLTQALMDRFIELQQLRNAALALARGETS